MHTLSQVVFRQRQAEVQAAAARQQALAADLQRDKETEVRAT